MKFGTVKALMQGRQINNSAVEKQSLNKLISMPTLIEEIKPVVLAKYEF